MARNLIEIIFEVVNNLGPGVTAAKAELQQATSSMEGFNRAGVDALEGVSGASAGLAAALVPVAGIIVGAGISIGILAHGAQIAEEHLRDLAKTAREIDALAQALGQTRVQAQGLREIFGSQGITEAQFSNALASLNDKIAQGSPALRQLEIDAKDSFGALLQLADLFSRTADGPNKTAAAIEVLGERGKVLIPVLNRGSASLVASIASYQAFGVVVDDLTSDRLLKYDEKLSEIDARYRGLQTQMLVELIPAFELFAGAVTNVLGILNDIPQAIDDARTIFRQFVRELPGGEAALNLLALKRAVEDLLKAEKDLEAHGGLGRVKVGPQTTTTKPNVPSVNKPDEEAARQLAKTLSAIERLISSIPEIRQQQRIPALESPDRRLVGAETFAGPAESSSNALRRLAESLGLLQFVTPPAELQVTDFGKAMLNLPFDIAKATESLEVGLKGTYRATLQEIVLDTQNFSNVMHDLWRNFLLDLVNAFVDATAEKIGIKEFAKTIVGFFIPSVAKGASATTIATDSSRVGLGPVTIQAIDADSFYSTLTRPGASGRVARERMEEIAGVFS